LAEVIGGEWRSSRGFEHDGIVGGDGRGDFVHHLVHGMVERGDGGDEVEGIARGVDAARFTVLRNIAGEDLRVVVEGFDGGKTQNVADAAGFVAGVFEAEAGFVGDEATDFFAALLDGGGHFVEDGMALVAGEGNFGGVGLA